MVENKNTLIDILKNIITENNTKYGEQWLSGFNKENKPIPFGANLIIETGRCLKKEKRKDEAVKMLASILLRSLYIALGDYKNSEAIVSMNDPLQMAISTDEILNQLEKSFNGDYINSTYPLPYLGAIDMVLNGRISKKAILFETLKYGKKYNKFFKPKKTNFKTKTKTIIKAYTFIDNNLLSIIVCILILKKKGE